MIVMFAVLAAFSAAAPAAAPAAAHDVPRADWVQTDACTVHYLRAVEHAGKGDGEASRRLGIWIAGSVWWMAHNGATPPAITAHLRVLHHRALAAASDDAATGEHCVKLEHGG